MDDKVSNVKKKNDSKCFCCCIGDSDEEAKFHQKTLQLNLSDELSSEVRSNIDHPESVSPNFYRSDKENSEEYLSPVNSSSDTMVHRKNNRTGKINGEESPDQGDAAVKDKQAHSSERCASSEAVRRNTLINSGRSNSGSLLSIGKGSESSSKRDPPSSDSVLTDLKLEDIEVKNKVKIAENNKKDTMLLRKKKKGFFHRLFRGNSAECHSGSEMEVAKDVLHLSKKKKTGKSDTAHSDNKEKSESVHDDVNSEEIDRVNSEEIDRVNSEEIDRVNSHEIDRVNSHSK